MLESKIKDYMGTTGLHAEAVSMLAATGPVEFERNLQTGDQLRMWAVAIDQKESLSLPSSSVKHIR